MARIDGVLTPVIPSEAKRSRGIPPRYEQRGLLFRGVPRLARDDSQLVDQPLLDSFVGIDPPIAQEWPVCPVLVNAIPFHIGNDNLLLVD